MEPSSGYQLLADPDSLQSVALCQATAKNCSIPLRSIEPPEIAATTPVNDVEDGGTIQEGEVNGDTVMRSPKRSILKRTRKTPENESERPLRVRNSRVLFANEFQSES